MRFSKTVRRQSGKSRWFASANRALKSFMRSQTKKVLQGRSGVVSSSRSSSCRSRGRRRRREVNTLLGHGPRLRYRRHHVFGQLILSSMVPNRLCYSWSTRPYCCRSPDQFDPRLQVPRAQRAHRERPERVCRGTFACQLSSNWCDFEHAECCQLLVGSKTS